MATRSKEPDSYAAALDAVAAANAAANRARLTDPDGHFPYKREEALEALRTPPEEGTQNHPGHWYTSEAIIEASAEAVEAERRYLEDPTDETKAEFREAMRVLSDARAEHRRGRPAGPVAMAGAPQEIEERNSMIRELGRAGWSAGQIAQHTNRPVAEVQGALNGRED